MPRPRKLQKSFEVQGKWARWTQYELVFNTPPAIFKAHTAKLQVYDPWKAFRENEGSRLKEPQPYVRLLNLAKQVRQHPGRELELALAWCNENGLLGILPAFADRLLFPPLIEESESGLGYRAVQVRYLRSGGNWRTESVECPWTRNRKDAVRDGHELDTLLPAPRVFGIRESYTKRNVSAQFFPLTGEIEAKFIPSGSPDAGSVFPSVPRPGSRAFLDVYGEPAWEITQWALAFERTVTEVSNGHGIREGTQRSLGFLADLASAASPTFSLTKKGRLQEVRVSAGLLASFALMALWDLEDGRRVHPCKNCGNYLVSKDPRAGYCSVKCRNTAQSRRYRTRKRTTSKGE